MILWWNQFRALMKPRKSTVEMRLGTESPVYLEVPEAFHREVIDAKNILLRPRKDGREAPVTLRMTCQDDLRAVLQSADQLRELLEKLNPGSDLQAFGSNVASMQKREDTDEAGQAWLHLHHAVYVSGFLCTATISIRKGMERAAEVGEVRDAMTGIFGSLRLKTV